MADPLSTTFKVLARSTHSEAVDLLISALDKYESIRGRAVSTLMQRNTTRGHLEVIRRLHFLTPQQRDTLETNIARLSGSLRQGLLHGDAELRDNALEFVRSAECYDQLRPLLQILEGDSQEAAEHAAETIRELVDRLYEHLHFDRDSKSNRRYVHNALHIRHEILTALDELCDDFAQLRHAEKVVEWVLILGDPDNFAVKKVLVQAAPEFRALAGRLLETHEHPGVMQLVLDFMGKNYPHRKALEALGGRRDVEFICRLLRWLPKEPTEVQQQNLRRIESVAWLQDYQVTLPLIPAGLQPAVVRLLQLFGVADELKTRIQQWIIRHGSPEGRLAAADLMAFLEEQTVQEIIFESLDSEDEDAQAWATGQLRARGIPEALTLLIERLDSPLESVRAAARKELKSFNLDFILKVFEHLDPLICLKAGELIQKIQPDCVRRLEEELVAPLRHRRMRAVRATQAMGFQRKVMPTLRALVVDDDSLIRRTLAEMLADVPAAESIETLQQLQDDSSPRVREMAAKSLEKLKHFQLNERIEQETSLPG